jgi:uncharacterized membrane protein (UPF0182 family)
VSFRGPEGDDLGPPPPPFRFTRRRASFSGLGNWNRLIGVVVFLLVIYVVLNTLKSLYVDWLWFDAVGYSEVYTKVLTTRIWLFFGGAGIFLVVFGLNLALAARSLMQVPPEIATDIDARALRRLVLLGSIASALFLAVIFGTIAASEWDAVLRYLNAESFGVLDPQFDRDIGFYVFKLPALQALQGWLTGMLVLTVLAAAGMYLSRYLLFGAVDANRTTARVHLSLLLVAIIAVFIWRYWLGIFDLSFSTGGAVFGAGYTDVNARLPVTYVLMAFAVLTALAILVSIRVGGFMLPAGTLGVWLLVAIFGGQVYPVSVQRLSVDPNEFEKEREYIERNITMTRQAFGLDQIDERPFPAALTVSQEEVDANPDTIRNIRLLDVRPLLQTYSQIQTIRPLYVFQDVDIDRYMVDGVLRQVMVSPRELSSDRLPVDAQSWVNQRLEYTHGYGVVMSPVNEVVEEGLPQLFLRDIPVTGKFEIERPEIYYGEQPGHYVIVKTKQGEFDYPIGEGNETTVFAGDSGVSLSSRLVRLAFAWEFQDVNIAISGSLTSDSLILFRRNIQDRVETLAPFLTLDQDPYLVIDDGHLFWIQDAYTTTTKYPYSTPTSGGFNYIRNSVKVVINAYNGDTTFYLVDPTDPIVRSYAGIFPELFTPLEEMPASLRAHLRYPEDLFLHQARQYLRYHITDARALYNREDIWEVPNELFDDTRVVVEPYYVIMRIPGEDEPEFALILPLTPTLRENTIAWLAARSDGDNYGKLLAFRFPTDTLVYGPSQIESRIDQDPTISAQFSLWNQSGSRVIRGNLLMVPIGSGNLFIEPIYLQAETSQLPELKRVVVVNGNQIAMEETLTRSLEVAFGLAAASGIEGAEGTPVASPTVSGTPPAPVTPTPLVATPTPAVVTPTPSGLPSDVGELARQADAAYERAQAALRDGDFATYGVEIARVEELIQRIVELTSE